MKKFLAGLLCAFLCPVLAGATPDDDQKPRSDANITGHVVDARTQEHLSYITIAIEGTTIGTVTDATGHYYLKNLPVGEFTISASAIGYRTVEKRIRTVSKKLLEINFELEEEAVGLDEVVVTANRNESSKKTSATIVNVASARLFENTASSNLAQTMNFQPGLRVETNCGNCGTTQLRINGLEGQYSQILLDSRPIFSSLAGVYGLEQLPVSMIERVEVMRGGGSALFGSSAIGGVVNIITKEPLRNSMALANTTQILEGGRHDINTSLNGSFVSDDHKAGVYLFGMIRDRQSYDRNDDGFSDVPKISSETVGFRGYYRTSHYSRITAEYHHIHEFRRGGDSFDRPPHQAEIAEQLEHKIDGGGLRFDWFTPDYRHRFNLFTSAQQIHRDSYFGTEQNPDAYGNTKDKTWVAGAQYTHGMDRLLFSPAELTAGVEYNYNDLHDKILGYNRDFTQTSRIFGSFVQNEWKTEKYSVLVGARLDKHNLMKNAVVSPRANVRYSPSEKIGLRASYSSGYRAPQAYNEDLHVDALSGVVALIRLDPNLKPEYSHSVSASADLYHHFGSLQTNLLIEGFYTYLDDVFTMVKVGEDEQGNYILERQNASGATVTGINLEGKLGLPGIFEMQLGYTFQKSRYEDPQKWSDDVTPQKKMFRSPDHYGYFTTGINITRQLKASVFGNYTGKMLVQHNAGYVAEDTERMTPAFFDMGVRLSYDFGLSDHIRMEVNGGVKNLFDSFQKDLDRGPLKDASYFYGPSAPRTYFFGLKFYL